MKKLVLVINAALVTIACGSESTSPGQSTSDLQSACPTSPPENGAACDRLGRACSYGDDLRFGCRTIAKCGDDLDDQVWVVTRASCPEPPPTCPESAPKAASRCNDNHLGATCVYDGIAYTCTPCSGTLCFTESTWSTTTLATSCPTAMPNLGDACSSHGLFCNYNVCADDQIPPNQWAYGMGFKCSANGWVYDAGKDVCL